jgi:LmbE family N-acetylglucosaminyl deacetylase
MTEPLRLLAVLAHPDDESVALGGLIAKYAAEGVETYLLTATRGQRGWFGDEQSYPGPERLGAVREAELQAASDVLGIRELTFFDYMDGELDQADPRRIIAQIARQIRRIRPQVVVTFGHDGLYGHPDHIAICQFTKAAVLAAADERDARLRGETPHAVSKLYYRAARTETVDDLEGAFGEMEMHIDGELRRGHGAPSWMISTSIDATAHWEQVWDAVQCHRSQLPHHEAMTKLPTELHRRLWGVQDLYRVFSRVNGGRELETDLFDGLRGAPRHLWQVA